MKWSRERVQTVSSREAIVEEFDVAEVLGKEPAQVTDGEFKAVLLAMAKVVLVDTPVPEVVRVPVEDPPREIP